ncbi:MULTISPECIES: hypothetical protein [unclassified Methanoregula]|uniref:hypothetical protein n=1 Tax=unclassified Methanoregula TaxID=2649730 RepID=UPI0009D1C274|nr:MULTISPECIES: hypothetical protein [unclassified Methanoregula]OPX64731.1 MAG: hypothetical protein A4E33_00701 [Methanoregula sp. PtaB.Bin085]OPY35201.1 MAG: hypothetical protein A4E34_00878 [Methanoregula sp. PtaU1.Bin006]
MIVSISDGKDLSISPRARKIVDALTGGEPLTQGQYRSCIKELARLEPVDRAEAMVAISREMDPEMYWRFSNDYNLFLRRGRLP